MTDDVAIPDDWDGETYTCYSVMWPKSFLWRGVLNGLIDLAGTGWHYQAASGNVIQARDAIRATWEYNFKNEEVILACNDTTNEYLEGIMLAIQALAAKECCPPGGGGIGPNTGGSRGTGVQESEPDPYEEDVFTEEPPEGFDTWAEYRQHKCNAAHDIINQLQVDLASITNLIPSEEGMTKLIAWVIGVILTPVPLDDIVTLVALLTIAAFEYSFLITTAAELVENQDDLICKLYNSHDANDAKADLMAEIDGLVTGLGFAGPVKDWVMSIVEALTPIDSMNRLFTDTVTTVQDSDCSECEIEVCMPDMIWDQGVLTGSGDLTPNDEIRTLTSTLHTNGNQYIQFRDQSDPCCHFAYEIISVSRPLNYNICVQCGDVEVQPNGASAEVGHVSAVYYLGFAAASSPATSFTMQIRLGPYVP